MAKVADLSTALSRKSTSTKNGVILPNAWFYQIWEGLIALTVLLTTIFVSFKVAFDADAPVLSGLLYAFGFLYVVHIVLKFNVGYIRKGVLVLDKKQIKENYLKGTFCLDLITCIVIPLDYLSLIEGIDEDFKKSVRILKLLKILRFYSLTAYFGKIFSDLFFLFFRKIIFQF